MLSTTRRTILRLALLAMIGTGLPASGLALAPDEMFTDPLKETRARDIGRSLRCMVCQNQSIFDSNAPLAKDLRVLVRQRIDAGDSDREVINYVAARYGDYVLLKPPMAAHTYILWGAPIVLLLGGLGLMVAYHRDRRRQAAPQELSGSDRRAARRALKGESR